MEPRPALGNGAFQENDSVIFEFDRRATAPNAELISATMTRVGEESSLLLGVSFCLKPLRLVSNNMQE